MTGMQDIVGRVRNKRVDERTGKEDPYQDIVKARTASSGGGIAGEIATVLGAPGAGAGIRASTRYRCPEGGVRDR
ncbi:hypothetical protein ABZW30_34185 [Kitasatospora sp. NPDC004669]|uniref:hypothetical protein n=1 Tax=Kitasatospora sp. NPDC004669 TaxID=3154555 RepID=UPI0033B47036